MNSTPQPHPPAPALARPRTSLAPLALALTLAATWGMPSALSQEVPPPETAPEGQAPTVSTSQEVIPPSAVVLDPVVVTATPFGTPLDELIVPASELGGDELRYQLAPTLGDTLNREPGISSTSFGPGSSRPIIRGLDRERIRVLSGGLGTGDASNASEDHAVGDSPFLAQEIEVVRGPAALLYGSTAIGGVVNVVDQRIAEEHVGKPITGQLDARTATASEELSGGLMLRGQAGSINWYVDGFALDTDDLEIPGESESEILRRSEGEAHEEHADETTPGTLADSAVESSGFSLGLSHVWDQGFIGFSVNHFDSLYGIPGGHIHGEEEHGEEHHEEEEHGEEHHEEEEHSEEHHEEEEEAPVRIDLEQTRYMVKGQFSEPTTWLEAIRFQLQYSDYEHMELEGSEVGTVFENQQVEGRLELIQAPVANWKGTTGLQGLYSDFSAVGEEAFVPPSETLNGALFSFQQLDFDPVRVEFGGRYEYQEVQGPEDRSFHGLSGAAGVIWEFVEGYSIALNGTYTQRPPTATELFANGPHLATGAYEIGNADFDNEEALGLDLTLRKTSGPFTGSVSAFYYYFPTFLALNPTGGEEDGLPVFQFEAEEAEFIGGEAELTYRALDEESQTLDFTIGGDVVRATNKSNGDPLPRIPPVRGRAEAKYRVHDLTARVEGVFASEQDRTAPDELPTDGYAVLNVELSYDYQLGETQWTGYVRANNLTDEEVRYHTSFLKDVAPQAGRSFVIGLRTTF